MKMTHDQDLKQTFTDVRKLTEALVGPLSDADATVQAMDDASPAKWHLAHTSWFFETFVLRDHVKDYRPFHPSFHFLFNSYYEGEGARLARPTRGILTRPSLGEIMEYRQHVTRAVSDALDSLSEQARTLVTLGCAHEQQHQELLQTDILYLFSQNPMAPAVWSQEAKRGIDELPAALQWIVGAEGLTTIGHAGDDFAFDCETPQHKVWLAPHALGNRLITNAEWLEFIQAGGYTTPAHWLSDGWAWVKANGIEAPLHWRRHQDGDWAYQFGLDGLTTLFWSAPVTHVSYFEADAYASWAGARLPTEAEWEAAAQSLSATDGNFLDDAGPICAKAAVRGPGVRQMFGDVWEWTGSAYLPYPGFQAAAGAVGEYNGKFMSGQFVLRGGSCATPRGHARASYRNFFYPHQRWQYTGVRLAKSL